jgi:uncharacterized SAM-binding protein YcdF (DUF218 family)
MFFFLRKLAEALLLPIGMAGLLAILGVVLRRRWLTIVGVTLLYSFSTPVVAGLLVKSLERHYESKSVAASPTADAIVVLSGSNVRGLTASGIQWGESANRYFAGFDLAMAGKAKVLVFSAAGTENPRGPDQGAISRLAALSHGLPADRIIVTPRVLTTEDEARAVSKIPGLHSILLVTSAFHMPRAVLLFRARGLDVMPFPTDERILRPLSLSRGSLIPAAGQLRNSEMAMREYYGLTVYRILLLLRPASLRD